MARGFTVVVPFGTVYAIDIRKVPRNICASARGCMQSAETYAAMQLTYPSASRSGPSVVVQQMVVHGVRYPQSRS